MKKSITMLLAMAASLSVSMAQTIVNTGFKTTDSPPYGNGDLAGQQDWTAVLNTGTNAFQVTDSAGSGFADTVPTVLSTNGGGNYVYIDTTALGNSASDEWDGVMDFTLSVPTNNIAAGDILRIGLSTSETNALGTGSSDIPLRINAGGSGNISINSGTEAGTVTMLSLDAATMGWSPGTTNNVLVTDEWRLSWKIRKTTATGIYSMTCSMENLTNPTNFTGSGISMTKTNAYDAAGLYTLMGRSQFAEFDGDKSINITIDDLSFIKSAGNPVILYPTPVLAEAGDAIVNLSWAAVPEAASYDVKRSDTGIGGTYSTVAGGSGITTNVFSDTSVVNGTDYYYKITSVNGAITADSDPVLAQPDAPVTGVIIDTTFDTVDGYTDGDLNGQDRWKSIAASGAPAFNVDSTGNGFAETATYSNSFDMVNGNQIYYNRIMENGVNAEWSGSVQFTIQTTPLAGNFVTKNSNTLEVAVLPGNRFMDLGITSDSSTTLVPNGDDDALINLRSNGNGDVLFLLNGNTPTIHRMLSLTRNQLGWDPEWANNTAAPDFETEPITLDWAIRKTAINNAYMCALEVTVGTNVYVGMIHYTDSSVSGSQPVDLYVADVARFALSHAYAAQESGTSMLDLSIDAISLTHTNEGTLLKATPYDVSGSATGDKEITISWSGAIEADSYDVYRSTDSGNNYSLLTNTTAQSCVDTTGLADLYTYFYVVKAKYAGGDSDASDPVHVRAVSFSAAPGLEWGPSTDIITAGNVPFVMDNVVSNGLTTSVGNPFTSASGYNTNAAPHLFGVMQTPGTYKRAGMYNNQTPTGNDQFEFNGDGLGYGLIYMEVPGLPLDLSTGAYSMKAESIVRSWHAVIHDSGSGNWYVGDAKYRGDMGALNAQTWRLLDVASTTANNTSLMDYAANPITTPDLTQVDKIGVLSDGGRIRLYHIVVKVGSSASLYDLWSDNYGIYNADAASTNDYDNDGFSNAWEWGMGGDPTNPNNQGIKQAEYLNVGTNMVYIYPRLKSSARPNYFLTEGSNLIYDPPTNSAAYPMEAGGTWINQPDFEAVTNYIPTTDAVKFIKLNIE